MSVRHFALLSLVCAAALRISLVTAGDLPLEPVLGQAVPIGRLLLVSGGLEDVEEPAPPAPIPQVEAGLIPLPFDEPSGRLVSPFFQDDAVVPRAIRSNPAEIQRHLSQASEQLTAAGLTDEAQRVGLLLHEFQTKHYARLLLAQKQSQLETLQAEINDLRASLAPTEKRPQIMISMKFIEGPAEVLNRLAPRLAAVDDQHQPIRIADDRALWKAIQDSKTASRLTILAAPTVTTLSGHTAQVMTGAEPAKAANLLVGSTDEQVEFVGTKVFTTATALSPELVRLSLAVEYQGQRADKPIPHESATIPKQQRLESLTEVRSGETLAYHIPGQTPPVLLVVKTSIVPAEAANDEASRKTRTITPVGSQDR